ncbi:hypothetical protein H1O16_gp281 [Burkholderia phage BcepSaruman]|uniref:Uncharacterized protein n=1 Tax=Burkholderia phage BcepSaruman TaxID=2530032 RepID=A0A4D5ZCL1_9CAUD|nr:hypothetical protein H1O16_gp281 [Burkholderia phage BcepSaruman]QBX06694.1 hypothetical protein BcepSaruman_281 [Burkholderia phage BcepSaruman]
MDSTFYYSLTLHRNGVANTVVAPTVDTLPIDPTAEAVILASTEGPGRDKGAYIYDIGQSRWRFALPYTAICQGIIDGAAIDLFYEVTDPNSGLPTRSKVWRNGVEYPGGPTFIANDGSVYGATTTANYTAGDVRSVNNQTPDPQGNVVVKLVDNNAPNGVSLIKNDGSTTGNLSLAMLVAGSGITIAPDGSGNLVLTGANQYVLPAAGQDAAHLGGVYVPQDQGIQLSADGKIVSAVASSTVLGAVKIGANINVTADGTISVPAPVPAPVSSVSAQTGAVVIQATNNNGSTGTSLITDSGATTGNIKLKTLVAGSNVTLASDPNGNLQINAQGNVQSVSGQTGVVVIQTTDNNAATGTSLISNNGSTTGNAKLKTLVAGNLIQLGTDANGNITISSTATSGALTAVNNEGTGTGLVDNNGTAGGIATIKSLAAGSNVTITPSGDNKTLTIAANQVLNPATTSTIGGVIVKAGLTVDGTGNLSLAAPTGVNLGGVKAGSGISIAADGTISATGAVASVSGQTGVVVVQATNNNGATGTSLISDSGSTTGNIKLKTLVAGSGVTITPDANGNLSIASTASGGVSSITAGTSGALTGAITFTAGPAISLSNTGNSIQISGTGVPEAPNDGNGYMRQNLGWSVVPSIANAITSVTGQAGTGAVLLVESSPPANSAIIKSLVAGQNVTLSEANGLVTVTAAIPAGTVSTVNGISPNGSGNVSLTAANVNAVPVSGNVTMTGPLSMGSQVLNGLTTPTTGDAAVPLSFLQNLTIDGGVIG